MSTLERLKIIKGALGRDYVPIEVSSLVIDDDCYGGCTAVVCVSHPSRVVVQLEEGGGIGMVDAIFDSFKRHFVKKYISLESISVYAYINTCPPLEKSQVKGALIGRWGPHRL